MTGRMSNRDRIANLRAEADAAAKEKAAAKAAKAAAPAKPRFPDLILIDGGRGQLNAACAELDRLGSETGDVVDQLLHGPPAKKKRPIARANRRAGRREETRFIWSRP